MFILIDPDLNQAPMQLKQLMIETELENWRIRTKQEAMMTEKTADIRVLLFQSFAERRYHQHGSNKVNFLISLVLLLFQASLFFSACQVVGGKGGAW